MKPVKLNAFASRSFIFLLFGVGFVIRLLCLFALRNPHKFHGASQAGADAVEFNAIAMHLVRYHEFSVSLGHPTSFRAPGFPFFLAGVYSLSYENYLLGYLSQCLLGAFGCVLAYLLAKELLPEIEARFSGILAVFYFPAIYFCTIFLSETLFADLFALGILFFLKYLRATRLIFLAASGVTLGIATLTRPFAELMLPALLGLLGFSMLKERKLRLLHVMAFFLSFLSAVAPWTWRNYLIHHKFVSVATNGGSTFYGSNNDLVLHNRAVLGRWVSTGVLPFRDRIDATPDEVSHDRLEQQLGKEWVTHHLSSMPLLETYKSIRLWLPDFTSRNPKFVITETIFYLPYLIFFMAGFVLCIRKHSYWSEKWWTLHLTVVALLVSALVFNGDPRYRDGIYTTLMPYAALGLSWLRGCVMREATGVVESRGGALQTL